MQQQEEDQINYHPQNPRLEVISVTRLLLYISLFVHLLP